MKATTMSSSTFLNQSQSFSHFETASGRTQPCTAPGKTESTQPAIRRIVLLTDFSPLARRAYSNTAGLAKKQKATILLVHIDRLLAPEYSGITNADYLQSLRERLAVESRRDEFEGLSIKPILKSYRDVARAIESFGSLLGGDLVVASTPASTGLQRLHEFDRAESVVAKASVPALLHGPRCVELKVDRRRQVLVYGESVASVASTVSMIRSLVCNDESKIRLLMPRSSIRNHWFTRNRTQQYKQDQSFQVALFDLFKIQLADFNVEIEFTQRNPCEEIRKHRQEMDADLIVLGTNRKYAAAHRTVIRESNCPVLFVRRS